jgi:DNA replication protein DnaC
MEARDERRLLRLQKQMAGHKLLIIDELGFVPLSKTGAELLFVSVRRRRPARVGERRIVSAMNSGHYGPVDGASSEAALDR